MGDLLQNKANHLKSSLSELKAVSRVINFLLQPAKSELTPWTWFGPELNLLFLNLSFWFIPLTIFWRQWVFSQENSTSLHIHKTLEKFHSLHLGPSHTTAHSRLRNSNLDNKESSQGNFLPRNFSELRFSKIKSSQKLNVRENYRANSRQRGFTSITCQMFHNVSFGVVHLAQINFQI